MLQVAVAIAVGVTGGVFLVRCGGSGQPTRSAPAAVAGGDTAVTACSRTGVQMLTSLPVPPTVWLPAAVKLPARAIVYGGVESLGTSTSAHFVIAPKGATCYVLTGAADDRIIAISPQSGETVQVVSSAGGVGATVRYVCAFIPQVTQVLPRRAEAEQGDNDCLSPSPPQLDQSRQRVTIIATSTPGIYVTMVQAPPGSAVDNIEFPVDYLSSQGLTPPLGFTLAAPTVAVFAAHIYRPAQAQPWSLYAPEIACTLPSARVTTCVAALNFFLTQFAASEGVPSADLAQIMTRVDRLVAPASSQ